MPRGPEPKYRQEFVEQAYKLCLLGLTDEELGTFFGVAERTINRWKKDHQDFRAALTSGKEKADGDVVERLYRRAMGYSHEAVKIVADAKTGAEHIVPYTEHYPPDTTACIFWLKNRQPAKWRDRVDQHNTGETTTRIIVDTGIRKD